MDRLTSLRVFREVVEAGGFSRAAARLTLSAPMASKHVAQLERDLERASRIGATGVDFVSVGALTHSVTVFDIGMDLLESGGDQR